jgi:hypothetical protein
MKILDKSVNSAKTPTEYVLNTHLTAFRLTCCDCIVLEGLSTGHTFTVALMIRI